jgi:hypothetical protein
MEPRAEVDLPAAAGPGVGVDQQAAVERNMKAAAFLMEAMPNSEVINIMAAGISDPPWPNQLKAHLMVTYLWETHEDNTTLLHVTAKGDLEKCNMKKVENLKVLFENLTTVKFKYQGSAQANITEDDTVAQVVQALPAIARLYETMDKQSQ